VRAPARDVWQFDQQACSSPQVLFLENETGLPTAQFLSVLRRAFEAENRAHPRQTIASGLTFGHLPGPRGLVVEGHRPSGRLSMGPDWTLLSARDQTCPSPRKQTR